MVFEQLYPAELLKKHPAYGFLLGIGYTIIALFIALMIWKNDPALIAVGIISLLLMPSLNKLTDSNIITEKTTIKTYFRSVLPQTKVYVALFFGIFFTFAFFSMILPKLAAGHLFRMQLDIIAGKAIMFSPSLWWDLFSWNLQVLGMCFFLSLIAGNGAILFITWNASVWGTIFGNLAKTAAMASTANVVIVFILIIISVFPHTFLEGLSYMISSISGSTLSDGITKQELMSQRMWKIAKLNLILLLIGVLVLAIGMMVETYALGNFDVYRSIINLAFPR